jgi:two-component system nitrate/nitrite response regulator NarL
MFNTKSLMTADSTKLTVNGQHNLVLCSENRLFREGLRHILTSSKVGVVAEARSLAQVLTMLDAGEITADLMVCDADAGFAEGFETLKAITDRFPKIGIVVLADQMTQSDMDIAMQGGARGFLPKDISAEALQISLELVLLGEDIFAAPASLTHANFSSRLPAHAGQSSGVLRAPLSLRESQILRCLESGLPNKTIARDLDMAEATVKVHLKALLRKINVENRTQAAIWSVNNMNPSVGEPKGT